MANKLKECMVHSINQLFERGWSQRRIARELGLSRTTVALYVKKQSGPGVPAGSGTENGPGVPTGSGNESGPGVPTGSQSLCLPHAEAIQSGLTDGLTAQRIYQDLVEEHGFVGSYDSVKRYVRQQRSALPLPFRRLECEPGQEAQIDFGTGGRLVDSAGKSRRTHLFRIVLSHSRRAYSEAVLRQDTESFIRVIENALRYFGGVPKTLVVDNLKAAVITPDWADPQINCKLRDFCFHYGTVLLPCKVRMPRHKGKVERAVAYAQDNALKGRTFRTLAEQNEHLRDWEQRVADTRIHGTTREQVRSAFEREKPHLQPLPDSLFPVFEEAMRKVNRDGHVEVAKSFYSAPPEYLYRALLVRWDLRTVRLFDPRTNRQVRIHACVEPGRFATEQSDIPAAKRAAVERGEHRLLHDVQLTIGDQAHSWGQAMLKARGIEGIRVLVGLLGLGGKYPSAALNQACQQAKTRQLWRLQHLRDLIAQPAAEQPTLQLQQQHDIIRDLSHYQHLIDTATPTEPELPTARDGAPTSNSRPILAPSRPMDNSGCDHHTHLN